MCEIWLWNFENSRKKKKKKKNSKFRNSRYSKRNSFFCSFLFFKALSTKFPINSFLIQRNVYFVIYTLKQGARHTLEKQSMRAVWIKKGHTYFSKFRVIRKCKPPKQHANIKLLECTNAKQNSKRALRAGTGRNKCLK